MHKPSRGTDVTTSSLIPSLTCLRSEDEARLIITVSQPVVPAAITMIESSLHVFNRLEQMHSPCS